MRRLLFLAAGGSLALALTACATLIPVSSHVQRGVNFAGYQTYDWGPADALPSGDSRLETNAFFDDHVHGAIDRELMARGLTRATNTRADLLVHYHASVKDRLEIVSVDHDYGECIGSDCGPAVNTYDAGVLVIDLVDARYKQVVWRGWAEHRLEDMLDRPDRVTRRINDAVRRIIATLPQTGEVGR